MIQFTRTATLCFRYRQTPGKKADHTKIFKDLISIAEERNMIAHYMLDASLDSIETFWADKETISLLKFEKTRSREIFTRDRVEILVGKVHALSAKFIEYNRLIPSVPAQGPPSKNLNED